MKNVALVFLRRLDQVLLGTKKNGFGQGKIVAVGGHIEAGETPQEAAIREFFEETGAQVFDLTLVARVEFIFSANPRWNMLAHVFESFVWQNELLESSELVPQWFDVSNLPFAQMWDDAAYWVKQLLAGARFDAQMIYARDSKTIEKATLKPWDT